MAFIVGLCILEDEAVGALKAIGTLLHTVGTILEMQAFLAVLRSLWRGGVGRRLSNGSCTHQPLKWRNNYLCERQTHVIK